MSRKVEGLDNLNRILTLPIGSKFGMFADDSITLFKVAGYLDRVAKASEDPFSLATVIVPTYPLLRRGHSPSGPKRNRDILHQHDRTQQRQTLKGNLMLTLIFLFLVVMAFLVFIVIWDGITSIISGKFLTGGILGFLLGKHLKDREDKK